MSLASSLPHLAQLARGIHWEMFGAHRVYFAITSAGFLLDQIGVPIGQETDDAVICSLAVALDRADPQPRLVVADRAPRVPPAVSGQPRARRPLRSPRVLAFPS
jgi:hypothetical protein